MSELKKEIDDLRRRLSNLAFEKIAEDFGLSGGYGPYCDALVEDLKFSAELAKDCNLNLTHCLQLADSISGGKQIEILEAEIVDALAELQQFKIAVRLQLQVESKKDGSKKDDTKHDTPKKPRKKRQLNAAAIACIRRHKADELNLPMKSHVEDYVAETNNSTVSSIMRILNDHSEEWKHDTKTT